MAKFQLSPGELLMGEGPMAIKENGLFSRRYQGKTYVTNRKICFYMSMSGSVLMELALSETEGFTVGRELFFTAVTIHSRSGERFPLTGFPAKKLQGWLLQLNIPKLG